MLKISVIIPVYNSANTIIECIDSVIRELDSNPYSWELIIVDDGSKDNSVEKINQHISKLACTNNIMLIQQKNTGAAAARNTGIKASQGEFIAFNDSDDKWIEGKLSSQMKYFVSHPDIDMVAGIFGGDNLSTIPTKKIEYSTSITIKDQVLKNYFSPQTTVFRRNILDKTGLFNEKMRYAEEGYFFNRMVYYGTCVVLNKKVTEPILFKGRWGDTGLSGNLKEMEKGELSNICEAYKSNFIRLPLFVFAVCFSIIKYLRRVILKQFRFHNK
jgi:glycosyltransferase involved in cell wall biosynthesis